MKQLSDYVEDLKRNELIKPQPGESKERARERVLADLKEHDRLNHSLEKDYRSFRGSDGQLRGWQDIPAAKAPARVVFMFLVVDRLKSDAWWREWFARADATGHKDHYSIVYHRGSAFGKGADAIQDDLLAERGVAVWPATKTGWARNGLVRATLLLQRFALEEPQNQWFVLLSDTCMPLYSFHDLFQILKRQKESRFRDFGMTLDIAMQRNIWQAGVCTNERFSHKADQWAMWVRTDVEWFVRENHLLRLKPLTAFVDEQYFINMMDEHGRPYQNAATTYTRWYKLSGLDIDLRKKEEGLKKFVSSPHTFDKVDMRRIRRARRTGCWFMRKVGAGAEYLGPEDLDLAAELSGVVLCSNGAKALMTMAGGRLHLLAGSSCEMCFRGVFRLLSLLTCGWVRRERRVQRAPWDKGN